MWRTPVAPRDVMWVSCWVNNKCTENMLFLLFGEKSSNWSNVITSSGVTTSRLAVHEENIRIFCSLLRPCLLRKPRHMGAVAAWIWVSYNTRSDSVLYRCGDMWHYLQRTLTWPVCNVHVSIVISNRHKQTVCSACALVWATCSTLAIDPIESLTIYRTLHTCPVRAQSTSKWYNFYSLSYGFYKNSIFQMDDSTAYTFAHCDVSSSVYNAVCQVLKRRGWHQTTNSADAVTGANLILGDRKHLPFKKMGINCTWAL